MTFNEYKNKKNYQCDFIRDKFSMKYSAEYICKTIRDGWDCFEYTVTFTGIKHPIMHHIYTTKFYHGTGLIFENGAPRPPLPFSVLSSIYSNDTKGFDFEDWCIELGFDIDSRKALSMYLECQSETKKFKKAFPEVRLEDYEEIVNY